MLGHGAIGEHAIGEAKEDAALNPRADRVRIVANTLFGRVVERIGDTVYVEIPADMISAAGAMFAASGFTAVIAGQTTRMETRRLTDMDKRTVFDHAAQDLMAFYTFKVSLAAREEQPAPPQPTVASITRQVGR